MRKTILAITAVICMTILPTGAFPAENIKAETINQEEIETPAEVTEPTVTPTPKPAKKKGLVQVGTKYVYYKDGKKIRNRWKTIQGVKYYFGKDGYAYTGGKKIGDKIYVFDKDGKLYRPSKPSVIKYGKNLYYVDTNGQAKTGWFTVGARLYRADYKGRLKKDKTYAGITFNKKGYANKSLNASLKKKVMRIVSRITNPGMSQSQKLYACWRYLTSSGNFYYGGYDPDFSDPDWYKEEAYNMLLTGGGNCYGFACTFAALAKEIGYDPYVVAGRVTGTRDGAADGLTRHGWVMINGCYYDPEGQFAGWFQGVYGEGTYNINHTVQRYVRFKY